MWKIPKMLHVLKNYLFLPREIDSTIKKFEKYLYILPYWTNELIGILKLHNVSKKIPIHNNRWRSKKILNQASICNWRFYQKRKNSQDIVCNTLLLLKGGGSTLGDWYRKRINGRIWRATTNSILRIKLVTIAWSILLGRISAKPR